MNLCPKCLGKLCRRLLPANGELSHTDRRMAQWIALTLATLLPVVILLLSGCLQTLDDAQLRLLAGHPFYIGAEEAQISLLSPIGTFILCTLLSLWLAAALLREPRYSRRCELAFLTTLAIALPGLLCVLWDGVLYISSPLACVALLWVFCVPLSALRRVVKNLRRSTSEPS